MKFSPYKTALQVLYGVKTTGHLRQSLNYTEHTESIKTVPDNKLDCKTAPLLSCYDVMMDLL